MKHLGVLLLGVLAVVATFLVGGGVITHATPDPVALNTNAATDSGADQRPQLTTDGAGNWVAVWESDDDLGATIETDSDILVARSSDDGATWTAPAALNTDAAADGVGDFFPQVATDGVGNWVAIWARDVILVARSVNNGATWTAPATLGDAPAFDLFPQVTTDGAGNWVAVWASGTLTCLSGSLSCDIQVSRSTDNGVNWTTPDLLASGLSGLPQVTTDAGDWVAVWQSGDTLGNTIGPDADILTARSTDAGVNWTAPAALNANAATDSGNDVKPQVSTDGAGDWVAVWESDDDLGATIGTDQDILFSRSTNAGVDWAAPAALNTNAATDSGDDGGPPLPTPTALR